MNRVLILAYYFPPAGGPAVQRILQFVEFLEEEGWRPEVLTVRQGAYPNRDPSLLDAVPESVAVHRTAALDPLAAYQRLKQRWTGDAALPAGSMGEDEGSWLAEAAKWVRANVFIPDARIGWFPFAYRRGRQLVDSGRFQAILTSGAPHSVHVIGRSLHRATGVPWVADLHDPWTDISYYDEFPHTDWAREVDASLERSVLAEASAVTTVSPSWADLFAGKAENRYHVVENGFDERDFDERDLDDGDAGTTQDAVSSSPSGDRFVLSHVGKLYASRNPKAVWEAVASLREEDAVPDLTIRLIGTVDPAVRDSIRRHGIEDVVEYQDFVPHGEALRAMGESALLLLVIEPFAQAKGMITSKLYEYLASERPVLGVGPPSGDANALLAQHDAGEVVAWNDARRARTLLQQHYDAWSAGSLKSGASRPALTSHTRRTQAQRMATVLRDVSREGNEGREKGRGR